MLWEDYNLSRVTFHMTRQIQLLALLKKSVGCHCRYDRWKTYFGK